MSTTLSIADLMAIANDSAQQNADIAAQYVAPKRSWFGKKR